MNPILINIWPIPDQLAIESKGWEFSLEPGVNCDCDQIDQKNIDSGTGIRHSVQCSAQIADEKASAASWKGFGWAIGVSAYRDIADSQLVD